MKSSIFKRRINRPTAPSALDEDGDDDLFFSRSNETFKRVAAVESARRKEAGLKEAKEARNPLTNAVRNRGNEVTGVSKRVRLSEDEENTSETTKPCDNYSSTADGVHQPDSPDPENPRSQSISQMPPVLVQTLSGSDRGTSGTYRRPESFPKSIVVDLDSTDDELDKSPSQNPTPRSSKETVPIGLSDELEGDSDKELAEISRRARQKAQSLVAQSKISSRSADVSFFNDLHSPASMSTSELLGSPENPANDPVVQYLIDSGMEGTKPLIISRKYSQRLKESRLHWCQEQGFTDDVTRSIVLTFKYSRLYDSTSCKGLGFDVIGESIVRRGDMSVIDNNRIHLVAMTEKDAKELEEQRHRPPETQDGQVERSAATEAKDHSLAIRLVLRTKGMDDFKVKARPHNQLSRLLNAFKRINDISINQDAYLSFDGERLDSHTLVLDHGLEDMDIVDVIMQ